MNSDKNNSTTQTASMKCRKCHTVPDHRWFLHPVDPNNDHALLCTSCVLKSNIGLFCPTCLAGIDDDCHVICRQCKSRSHRACVGPLGSQKSLAFYTCPPCSNPKYTFFDLKKVAFGGGGDGDRVVNAFDKKSASAFYLAAEIAMNTTSKAAALARKEAEKKSKEAVEWRNKATEAFDRVGALASRERDQPPMNGNHA